MSAQLTYTLVSATTTGATLNVTSFGIGGAGNNLYNVTLYWNGNNQNGTGALFYTLALGNNTITYGDFVSNGNGPNAYTNGTLFNVTMANTQPGTGNFTPIFPTNYPNSGVGIVVGASAPCFTANSQLLTPAGYVKASTLRTGDVLMTSDGRQVPIKAYTNTFKADKESAPYLIPKNSLGRNVPAADLHLSPWHAISLGNGLWQKPQTAAELNPGVLTQYDVGKDVQYYHFEAPNYFTDNFICSGTVVESFGSKQVSEKEKPYTWSEKHQAYTRNMPAKAKKHVAM